MTNDDTREFLRRYFAAMERGNLDEAASFWATDAVNRGAGRPGQQIPPGAEMVRRILESLHIAFPDRRWQLEDVIAEGDKVVCRVTVSGTFGEIPPVPVEGTMLMTSPPTGKSYSVQHIHIVRLADGKIAEHWAARDDLGLLMQLGIIVQPQAAGSRT